MPWARRRSHRAAAGPTCACWTSSSARDQKAFDALLRAKADVNAAQPDGATALAWAVHLGEREMAEALLDAGANVATADDYGETPVTLAARERRRGAGAAAAGRGRQRPRDAMERRDGRDDCGRSGEPRRRQAAGRHGADVNAAEPRGGQTALMWAAAEGHGDVVAGLVEMGANVNAASKTGFTPLVFAVTKNDVPSIKTLLEAGADPNFTLPSGGKPLIVAMSYSHGRGAGAARRRRRVTARDREDREHDAAPRGAAGRSGSGARAAGPKGRSERPHAEVRPAPREGGWRSPATSGRRADAADDGGARDHEDVMRALVAAGADPTLRAQDGSNLLMMAAVGARLKTFRYAYELDPHVDVVTQSKATVMHPPWPSGSALNRKCARSSSSSPTTARRSTS